MKVKNIKALENLSLFCHLSGILTVYLGLVVIFLDLHKGDFAHIQIGFFILITGYAFVKISQKLAKVMYDESKYDL